MGFMLSTDVQGVLLKAGFLPAVIDVPIDDPLLKQMLFAFRSGVPYPTDPAWDAYWDPLEAAMLSVFDNGVEPAAALRKAETEVRAKLAETPAPSP
jgi:maltose-binding protein MalE